MQFKLDDDIRFILEKLNNNGTGFIVGGAIRDIILGKNPGDYDFATDIDYNKLKKIFSDYNPKEVGAHFGILMIKVNNKNYEIAKFRKEAGVYNSRYPKEIRFVDTIEKDLERRDFTINAMAYNEKEGIIDLYNGKKDLKNKIIRFVGNPKLRIEEDALRIMRAFRFISKLGFSLDKSTSEAIFEKRRFLYKISKERIFNELSEILLGPYVKKALYEMRNLGILELIIPEFRYTYNFNQTNNEYDILFNHIVRTVTFCEKDLITRFSALFHDLGKISTKVIDAKGNMYYYGHEKESAVIAEEKLRYLKASNDVVFSVKKIVLNHTVLEQEVADKILKKLVIDLEFKNVERLFNLLAADSEAKIKRTGTEKIDRLWKRILELKNTDQIPDIKKIDITGVDLMNLNFDSKKIGNLKNEIFNLILGNELKNEKEEIVKYLIRKYNKGTDLKREKSCGALIYNKKLDKFLIVKMHNGNWGFPKGHTEEAETEHQTALREVFEETGINIEILQNFRQSIKYISNYNMLKEVIFFMGVTDDTEIKVNRNEIEDFEWCSYERALKIITYRLQRDVMDKGKEFIDNYNLHC